MPCRESCALPLHSATSEQPPLLPIAPNYPSNSRLMGETALMRIGELGREYWQILSLIADLGSTIQEADDEEIMPSSMSSLARHCGFKNWAILLVKTVMVTH